MKGNIAHVCRIIFNCKICGQFCVANYRKLPTGNDITGGFERVMTLFAELSFEICETRRTSTSFVELYSQLLLIVIVLFGDKEMRVL